MFVIIYIDWINTLSDINKSLEKCTYCVWHVCPSAGNLPRTRTDIFIQFDINFTANCWHIQILDKSGNN